MVTSKEYILTRFGDYSGLNPEFIQSFEKWDGNKIKDLLFIFISKSIMSWAEEKDLYDFEGNLTSELIDFDSLVRSDTLLGVSFELAKFYNLSEETLNYINRRSGFFCYNDKYTPVGFRQVVQSCFEFERITTKIAYRKAKDWFSEIYWNPHTKFGRKMLENRIKRDGIF